MSKVWNSLKTVESKKYSSNFNRDFFKMRLRYKSSETHQNEQSVARRRATSPHLFRWRGTAPPWHLDICYASPFSLHIKTRCNFSRVPRQLAAAWVTATFSRWFTAELPGVTLCQLFPFWKKKATTFVSRLCLPTKILWLCCQMYKHTLRERPSSRSRPRPEGTEENKRLKTGNKSISQKFFLFRDIL